MRLQDARTISPDKLLERRKQTVILHKKGMTNIEIAKVVGVHRNTVGEWIAKWSEGGSRGLKAKASGRPKGSGRRLTAQQEKAIQVMIADCCPDSLKIDFTLWTREAVRLLIAQETDLDMPIRTVGEYLKRWGFTLQKPVRRAYERCEASVRRWLREEYPRIAQQARQEGAEIQWGDATELRSDDENGRGYAPKGCTPVRRAKGTPEKIKMVSTVTNQGKVRFMFHREALNAARFICFLRRLVSDARGRKIYLILDNLRVHRSKPVQEWVGTHREEIALYHLPCYAPDLTPDEFLNGDLKSEVSRRADCRRKGRLAQTALSAMRRIQKHPSRVRKYYEAESIRYAR